jgi:hypothetical protein
MHLYHRLKPYILTEELLQENGYPRFDEDHANLVKFCNAPRTKTIGKSMCSFHFIVPFMERFRRDFLYLV